MRTGMLGAVVLAAFTAGLTVSCSRTGPDDAIAVGCDACLVLTGALVLDGAACVPATVVLSGNRIVQVAPPDALVLAGQQVRLDGATILPGLLDLHVHVTSPSGPDPGLAGDDLTAASFRAMLRSGVLTAWDLGASRHVIFEVRRRIREHGILAPWLLASGPLLTPSGGHPCYAGSLPEDTCLLVDTASAGRAGVAHLAPERPDVVKVVIESGPESFPLPPMEPGVLRAIVEQAAADELLVVAHISHAADMDMALEAGVRVFAHLPVYDEMTDSQASRLAAAGAVVIPTLAVRDGYVRLSTGTMTELNDPALADDVPASEIATLKDPSRLGKLGQPENRPKYAAELAHMLANLRRCMAAGVTIAAGTDAGNLGVFHGLALRRELELYVQQGMAAGEALRAATSIAADVAGERRRGRIEAGAAADLLVVRGNPCVRIEDLHEVDAVFLEGVRLDRESLSLRHSVSLARAAVSGRQAGEPCLRAGECGDGLACDADMWCSAKCESEASCEWGAVCTSSGFPESASTCQPGDACSLFDQDCPNSTACVWIGHGASRCWYSTQAVAGEPCASWAGCAPGHQCDGQGTCRAYCAPNALPPGCPVGQACVDDSASAGLAIGHCE